MSSPVPVPVPSKAAIRVLRGLVFGTTCSIALITEDRRRRIEAAQTAIASAHKLRQSRHYCAGAAEAVIKAREEDALWIDSWSFAPRHHVPSRDSHESRAHPIREAKKPPQQELLGPSTRSAELGPTDFIDEGNAPPKTNSRTQTPSIPQNRPAQALYLSPAILQQQWGYRKRRPPLQSSEPETINHHISKILEFCNKGESSCLLAAAARLTKALQWPKESLEAHKVELLEASALLSRTCQRAGDMLSASVVLRDVARQWELDEQAYFDHEPLPIIQFMLSTTSEVDRQFAIAQALFLPRVFDKPDLSRADEVLAVAETLIQTAFSTRQLKYVVEVMDRLFPYLRGPDAVDFFGRTLRKMRDHGMRRSLVRLFLRYDTDAMKPSEEQYSDMGDMVVDGVSKTNGVKAGEVLEKLCATLPGSIRLKTSWVAELLYQHWHQSRSFRKTAELFNMLCKTRGRSGVGVLKGHGDGAYRAIIQVALEAGEFDRARAYFGDLIARAPEAGKNVRIQGLFALASARTGDWDAVWTIFEEDMAAPSLKEQEGARIFVPILRAFADSHTVSETEAFLRSYMDRFGIPLHKFMITLMAERYGEVRDVKSFLAWMEYCSRCSNVDPSLRADAALGNSLLRSCRRHWKLSFVQLQILYRQLQHLNPNFSDEVTESIMTGSAMWSSATHRKATAKIASTRTTLMGPAAMAAELRCTDPFDRAAVFESMTMSIKAGRPAVAISTYKRARKNAMPDCPECLRLLSIAHVRLGRADDLGLLQRLLHAQQNGVCIEEALSPLFIAQLEKLYHADGVMKSGEPQIVNRHIEIVLQRMHSVSSDTTGDGDSRGGRVRVTSPVLMKAAAMCVRAGNYHGAVRLALMAADARGEPPGYNSRNFSILLDCYLALDQPDKIEALIRTATDNDCWAQMAARDLNGLKNLKQWRKQLRAAVAQAEPASAPHADAAATAAAKRVDPKDSHHDARGSRVNDLHKEALRHVETAIGEILSARAKLREERVEVSRGFLGIMEAAARDAERNDKRGEITHPAHVVAAARQGG